MGEESHARGRADVYVSVPGMHGRMLNEDFDVFADLIHSDDSSVSLNGMSGSYHL